MTGPWWSSMPSLNLDMPIIDQMQVIDNLWQYTYTANLRKTDLDQKRDMHPSTIGLQEVMQLQEIQGQITNGSASSSQSAQVQINYFAATEH